MVSQWPPTSSRRRNWLISMVYWTVQDGNAMASYVKSKAQLICIRKCCCESTGVLFVWEGRLLKRCFSPTAGEGRAWNITALSISILLCAKLWVLLIVKMISKCLTRCVNFSPGSVVDEALARIMLAEARRLTFDRFSRTSTFHKNLIVCKVAESATFHRGVWKVAESATLHTTQTSQHDVVDNNSTIASVRMAMLQSHLGCRERTTTHMTWIVEATQTLLLYLIKVPPSTHIHTQSQSQNNCTATTWNQLILYVDNGGDCH